MVQGGFVEIPEIFEREDFRLVAIVDALEESGIDHRVKMIVKPPDFLSGGGEGMPEPEVYSLWIRFTDAQKVADLINRVLKEQADAPVRDRDENCPACEGLVAPSGRCEECGLVIFVESEDEDDLLLSFVNEHRTDSTKANPSSGAS